MTFTRLEKLKKGLARFKSSINKCREGITAKLKQKERVSSEDERWLGNEGNAVDEDRVVDTLRGANTPDSSLDNYGLPSCVRAAVRSSA